MGCINGKGEGSNAITPQRMEVKHGDSMMIKRKYVITNQVLGAGNFGKVFLAYNSANHDLKVAIKSLPK